MDVFYFNSAPEPALENGGRASKWNDKRPFAKRRKVWSTMDASPYRAHVVSVAEPTVVANELSSLPSHYLDALLDAGYFSSSLSPPPILPDGSTADTPTTLKSDERLVGVGLPAGDDISVPLVNRIPPRTTRPIHSRPESLDLWEEEDSRRIRFALPDENDDHVERLRHSQASAHIPHRVAGTFRQDEPRPPQSAEQTLPPGISSTSIEPENLVLTPYMTLESFRERYVIPGPPPPPMPPHSASQLLWDENLLAVDDHRRDYGFADFMDQWNLRRGCDAPTSKPATGPSLWRRPQHEYARHDAGTGERRDEEDMQGLRWESFGAMRKSALEARRLLHPQRGVENSDNATDIDGSDGAHYRPRAFAPNHRARSSHYQLRNMTAVASGRDVYYGDGGKVKKASLSCPSAKQTVMDLAKPSHSASPFKVTCLASTSSSSRPNEKVLIAGGFNGEYAMLDLNSTVPSKPVEGVVSHAKDGIVNHINTFRDRLSGSLRAAFCSNDHRVRVMDVQQQHFTSTFEYDSAINCSATSADGRLRALVHDGPDSWITDAEAGEILVKLKAHTDFAFACDWSPCGRYVATGAEDRQVVVWDARNWSRPLHQQQCVMSCARSLLFADDGALVIAESEDVVSIVDTATFDLRQNIRFFGSIAGVSLLDGGAEMVIANADQTVGGLMSFQRMAKGRGSGGFGQRLETGGSWPRRRREYECSVVEEVFV